MRYYCQFPYGGFKTFRINGDPNELLDQEVTSENRLGFPEFCEYYFNHGGVKLLYRFIDDDTLALIVREIPGPTTSTDGTPINIAVQFVGNKSEKEALDKLCLYICHDMDSFQRRFSDMFSTRGGLHFEGDKLMELVRESSIAKGSENGISQAIKDESRTILLLVSENSFWSDERKRSLYDSLKLEGKVFCLSNRSLLDYNWTSDESKLKGRYVDPPEEHRVVPLSEEEQKKKARANGDSRLIWVVVVVIFLLVGVLGMCQGKKSQNHQTPIKKEEPMAPIKKKESVTTLLLWTESFNT